MDTTREVDSRGYLVLDKHAVVTFTLEDIKDLQLDGFSHQNAIGSLTLKRGPIRPDRSSSVPSASPDDWEIELEPCFGLDGRIRCARVSVSFVPGKPSDFREWQG